MGLREILTAEPTTRSGRHVTREAARSAVDPHAVMQRLQAASEAISFVCSTTAPRSDRLKRASLAFLRKRILLQRPIGRRPRPTAPKHADIPQERLLLQHPSVSLILPPSKSIGSILPSATSTSFTAGWSFHHGHSKPARFRRRALRSNRDALSCHRPSVSSPPRPPALSRPSDSGCVPLQPPNL